MDCTARLYTAKDFWERPEREAAIQWSLMRSSHEATSSVPEEYTLHDLKRQFDQELEVLAVQQEKRLMDASHNKRWSLCVENHRERLEEVHAKRRASTEGCVFSKTQHDLVLTQHEMEIRQWHREVSEDLRRHEKLVQYIQTGYLWRDRNFLRGAKRPLSAVIEDFKEQRPDEVAKLWARIKDWNNHRTIEVEQQRQEVAKTIAKDSCAAVAALDAEFSGRVVPLDVRLSSVFTPGVGESLLPVVLRRCIHWLGCPQACTLFSLSRAATAEIWRLPSHVRGCPLARHCECCGFAVVPSHDQVDRLTSHRRLCAPWLVDGMFSRFFFSPPIDLVAGSYALAVRQALKVLDASDFPGVDRRITAPDALVCCPHYGCDEAFHGRELALAHAKNCKQRNKMTRMIIFH